MTAFAKKPTLADQARARCEECRLSLDNLGGGGLWFRAEDGEMHHHREGRARTSTRIVAFQRQALAPNVPKDEFEPTAEELAIGRQLGVSRDGLRLQKMRDANNELQGRIDALKIKEQFGRSQ
jgi:hypothetical protein